MCTELCQNLEKHWHQSLQIYKLSQFPSEVLSNSTLPHQFNVSMLCIYLQLHNFSSPLETINKVDAVDDCKYINGKSSAPNTKGCTFKKSSVQWTWGDTYMVCHMYLVELLVFCEFCSHVLDSNCLSFCSNGLLQTQEDSAWYPHQMHNPGDYHPCPAHGDKAQASTQGSCHWPCLQLVLCHAPPFLLLVLCKSMSLHTESCSALPMLSSETVFPAIPQAQRTSSAVQQNTVALALLPATQTPRDSDWCWQPHHNGKKRQENRLQG